MNFHQSPPAFPKLNRFEQFFDAPVKRKDNRSPIHEYKSAEAVQFGDTKHRISEFVSVRNGSTMPDCYYYFNARLKPQACEWIAANMLAIDNDSIYFEIILHKTGAVIWAKYNQILGSRMLGSVKLETVPTEEQFA